MRAFFNYLVANGYILYNQFTLKPKKIRKSKSDYLSLEEMKKLISSFDLRKKLEIINLLIVMILLDTGIQLVLIRLEDINYIERSIYIYAPKTDTFRTVYYTQQTEAILKTYITQILKPREKGNLLLTFDCICDESTNKPMTKKLITSLLRRKGQKIFGKAFRMNPHKFRHTFATHHIINGEVPFFT